MVVSYPRKGLVRTEPRDMVRVQLKPNDIRSYTREEAEELVAKTAGAFIVGEQDDPAIDATAPNKGRRSASSKPRQTAPSTPAEPPAEPPATPTSD